MKNIEDEELRSQPAVILIASILFGLLGIILTVILLIPFYIGYKLIQEGSTYMAAIIILSYLWFIYATSSYKFMKYISDVRRKKMNNKAEHKGE